MINVIYRKLSLLSALSVCVFFGAVTHAYAAGPTKQARESSPQYSLPASLITNPFRFAGEIIPLQRQDVRSRIQFQVNFLLLDARSVLTLWLSEESRHAWIIEEVFEKEGIPREFAWLAPIMTRMKRSGNSRHKGGLWALEKPCTKGFVPGMYSGKSYDDRLDVELSTKCFAAQLKEIKKKIKTRSWLMAAAAYMTSGKTIDGLTKQWNTKSFWNIPFADNPELLIPRWIALAIIGSHGKTYGLNYKRPPPATFDQVSGLVLTKDLPVAEIAQITGVPPRVILQLNPKISPSTGVFPAKVKGKSRTHTIAAPRGKGWILVKKLKKRGFLVPSKKP